MRYIFKNTWINSIFVIFILLLILILFFQVHSRLSPLSNINSINIIRRGLLLAVPQKYEQIAYENIKKIQTEFHFECPIEVWECGGQEISSSMREKIASLPNIIFRNVDEYMSVEEAKQKWRGFQVKAFIIQHTNFNEFILCDADCTFYQSPELLWLDPGYQQTGTYFFRDLKCWQYSPSQINLPGGDSDARDRYLKRRKWLQSIIPKKHQNLIPFEWKHMRHDQTQQTNNNIITKKNILDVSVAEAYMESGVVALRTHDPSMKQAIKTIFDLNENHTVTYKHVHGDKETFWIACCIVGVPFTINEIYPEMKPRLTQYYNNEIFYIQK